MFVHRRVARSSALGATLVLVVGCASSSTASGGGTSGDVGGASGGDASTRCAAPGLVWKTASKTHYTSYPAAGSEECLPPEQGGFNGCAYAGLFESCSGKQTEAWVAAHDIAAVYPNDGLARHDLCLRSGEKTMIVTALDTCSDDDCDGCCSRNRGSRDALIDLESYTDARWGLPDGPIEWADLGENSDPGCPE